MSSIMLRYAADHDSFRKLIKTVVILLCISIPMHDVNMGFLSRRHLSNAGIVSKRLYLFRNCLHLLAEPSCYFCEIPTV